MLHLLLLNILVILTPILFAQVFQLDRLYHKDCPKSKWNLGLMFGLASILCMNFPIVSGDQFLWDLRWIPFIMALLYGGFRAGIPAFILLVGYRMSLGTGLSFLIVLADAILFFVTIPLFSSWFHRGKGLEKVIKGAALSLAVYLLVMASIVYHFYAVDRMDFMVHQGAMLYISMAISYVLSSVLAITICENVMENRMIREKLRESEAQYRKIVEESPQAIIIHQQHKIVYANEMGVNLLGAQKAEQLLGNDVFMYSSPEEVPKIKERFAKYEAGKTAEATEIKLHRFDGETRNLEVKSIPTTFEGKPAIQTMFLDITEMKKARELLQQSEKLTVVGELAAGVAHEIRNPLTSLRGFIQLFQYKWKENAGEEDQTHLQIMLREIDRINMIVGELLLLAKPKKMDFEAKCLRSILHDVVTLLQPQAILENVQIQTKFSSDNILVFCAENKLKQVFINLLKNGIESMETGGEATITVIPKQDRVSIQFRDQGCGISKEKLSRMGQAFFTTKEKGTGLGMMVSFSIIDSHQGEIRIDSVEGKGTTIEVILPIFSDSSESKTIKDVG